MSIETAVAVYDALSKGLVPKARKSLENIKIACDLIAASRGVMNYSSVARIATENLGGPKKQTVQNSKVLKRYIAARIYEYTQATNTHKVPLTNKAGDVDNKYPTKNLDLRTKVYIDHLHSRLQLAEARYRNIRIWQEEFTRANPVCLAQAIGRGPTVNGAMQLEYQQDDSDTLHMVREGIRALLGLTEHFTALEVEARDDMLRLTLKRPTGDHVILNPQQYAAIQRFLKDFGDT